jgi:hypothetical protein
VQVKGAAKQLEGKLQNALGKVKDASKKAQEEAASPKPPQRAADDTESDESEEKFRHSRS